MFNMVYDIQIGNNKLQLLESVEIYKSVDVLTSTAVIKVPAVIYNKALNYEKYVKAGDKVIVRLGYDDKLETEFEGFLTRIDTDDDTLTFNCEDYMFLTRKPVEDKEFLDTSLKQVAEYCLSQAGFSELECTYDLPFEKYVISHANAFDVFRKIKEQTSASIYMKGEVLHIHPPYTEKGGDAIYSFSVNIENSDLKYKKKDDRKVTVEINVTGSDGKKIKKTYGEKGGQIYTKDMAIPVTEEAMKQIAEKEYETLCFDGYEGTITGWLIPYVEPSYSAKIIDDEYEYKTGTYYVKAVTTTFSEEGGIRKVELGKKLS